MKKLKQTIGGRFMALAALVLVVGAVSASAQQGWDTFTYPRTVVLAAPQTITHAAPIVTNGPIDRSFFSGRSVIDIFSLTNATASLTATVYTSNDQTNLTALSNFAFINSTTAFNTTNFYYGGTNGLTCANATLLPGVLTTPTAATAGYAAVPYLAGLPFTNAAAVTLTAKGNYKIGFNANDVGRYIYIVWTAAGTVTNVTVGATFTSTPINGSNQ